MGIFKLLPVDWQAIVAIVTFFAVMAALYSSYLYRKREKILEKREIIERIVHPLEENLNSLSALVRSDPPYLSDFKWQEIKNKNPYLILRLPSKLKYLMDSFYENLVSFNNLTNQRLPQLKKVMVIAMRPVNINENGILRNCFYRIEIGGKSFVIYFLGLLFTQRNLNEQIEKLRHDSALPNNKLGESKFILSPNKELSKEVFEEVFSNILTAVENNIELKEYIDSGAEIIKKAKNLLGEVKKYAK